MGENALRYRVKKGREKAGKEKPYLFAKTGFL